MSKFCVKNYSSVVSVSEFFHGFWNAAMVKLENEKHLGWHRQSFTACQKKWKPHFAAVWKRLFIALDNVFFFLCHFATL